MCVTEIQEWNKNGLKQIKNLCIKVKICCCFAFVFKLDKIMLYLFVRKLVLHLHLSAITGYNNKSSHLITEKAPRSYIHVLAVNVRAC